MSKARELRVEVVSAGEGRQFIPLTFVPEAWRDRTVRLIVEDLPPGFPVTDDAE